MTLCLYKYGSNAQSVLDQENAKPVEAQESSQDGVAILRYVNMVAEVAENVHSVQDMEDIMKWNIDNYNRSTWGTAPLCKDKF